MNTWQEVDRPKDKPVVKNKWVFKIKYNSIGLIDKYKARLVAKGFTQTKGIDYEETFAPVVRRENLRYLISYATKNKLEMHHMDVETAFLNGELEEEIYMEMPEGFEKREKVCKLEKSLYGLKQSSRVWHKKISSFLVEEGYLQSEADPCVFIKHHQDCISIIALYVDDCMIFGAKENVERAKLALSSQFKMKDLGEVKSIIGIQVERDKEETRIHQINYIRDVLKKFGMSDCKGVDTPLPTKKESTSSPIFENIILYQEAIGALNYLATNTRPDIAYAVSQVTQKMKEPNQDDWIKVKRIMRYLKKTESAKLTYKVKGS